MRAGGNNVASSFIYTLGVQSLHFETVGATLRATDTSRAFMPTSPSNGWLSEEMLIPDMCIHQERVSNGSPVAPEICYASNPARGDGHFYSQDPGVAFNSSSILPPLKFNSENGVESYASLKPLSTVTSAADRWIGSSQTSFRERAGRDQYDKWGLTQLQWVSYHFGDAPVAAANVSTSPPAAFERFLVLSQLAAGLGLRGMVEQFRLQKKSVEGGGTMGHLIWQLQDNWPGQSFGLLNYGGEWKQQLHFVRRGYAPLLLTGAGPLLAENISVHLISDIPSELGHCEVEAALWDLSSHSSRPAQLWSAVVAQVAPGGVAEALQVPRNRLTPTNFLRMTAHCAGNVSAENDYFAGPFAASRRVLRDPRFHTADWALDGASCSFTLECEAPALFVVLDSMGEFQPGRFSDGAFAMVAGERKVLSYTPAGGKVCELSEMRAELAVSSLYNLLD